MVGRAASIILAPSMGTHTYTLTVNDGRGGMSSDDVVMTMYDATPPMIAVSLSPSALWPPNHRMVDVTARVVVSDNCTPASQLRWSLTSITSNEPENGLGDGDTDGDIQGASIGAQDRAFMLRAERSGSGRVYTVTYTVSDASGNTSVGTSTVTVAHDQSYRSETRRESGDDDSDGGKDKGKKGKGNKGKR